MDGKKIIKVTSCGNYPKYVHAEYSRDGKVVGYFLLGRIRTAAPIDPKDVKRVMAVARARAIAGGMVDVHATAIDYKPKSGLNKPVKKPEARTADSRKTAKMWILCEAFTLTGDAFSHQTIHKSLAPWAGVYPTRVECQIALERHVRERVRENYEGLDDAEAYVEPDVAEVLRGVVYPDRNNAEYYRYNYSADDREVVWQVYPTEVAL